MESAEHITDQSRLNVSSQQSGVSECSENQTNESSTQSIVLADPTMTRALGLALARSLPSDCVVELSGTLGAGKTTFVRSLAEGVGVDPRTVSSPSFLTCNEYVVGPQITGEHKNEHADMLPVMVHIDAYLAETKTNDGMHEPAGIDFDEIARDVSCMVVVEWPARLHAVDWQSRPVVRIEFFHVNETARRAVIDLAGVLLADRERVAQSITALSSGTTGPSGPSSGPFATERQQYADLYKWLSGQYTVSRPLDPDDVGDIGDLGDTGDTGEFQP